MNYITKNLLYEKAFLIAPSGFINKNNLILAEKRLKVIKFQKIYYRKDILSHYLEYAGYYKRRAEEINEAYSSSADVIFAVIGGMGAIHTLPFLDYELINNSNKTLVGSSDVTILLNTIHQRTNARCIHGPNIGKNISLSKKSMISLINVLNKKSFIVNINEKDIFKFGNAEGIIVGGNLELLGRSLGTEFEINTDNKILFLEEYDMKSWRVFDILWQLKLAGKFDKVKGIILGYFTKCGNDISKYLIEFFKEFSYPLIINQPIGHSEPNLAIPVGEYCLINAQDKYWKIECKK